MKPEILSRRYLDYHAVERYFKKKYPQMKVEKVLRLLADRGNVHNGCFVSLEEPSEDMYEPLVEEFARALFAEFPDAAGEYGTIDLWVWW